MAGDGSDAEAPAPVNGALDVVVTGADGFVGRALCAHWRAAGVAFRGLVRGLTPDTSARADMLPVGDLATVDEAALGRALAPARTVVHLAGRAHVLREAASDSAPAYRRANALATDRVARAAAAAGVAHFLFASTVKVNGESTLPGCPFRESDPPDPRDVYAASKWEAERLLADVARDTGMRVTVLRLPLVYGPGMKGNLARLGQAVARGLPLPLAAIDNRRSLLGVANFASAVDALRARPTVAAGIATYFVADAESVSTPALVRAMAHSLGVAPRLFHVPVGVLRFAAACTGGTAQMERLAGSLEVDTTAFRAHFGWLPPCSLQDGLARAVHADGAFG
jgi:nucleoside-diphosphate-sugar epimerase